MSVDNALKQSADEYLRKHRIIELMEDLCSDLCYEQPQNINEFLIERLKNKQKQGTLALNQDSRQESLAKKKLAMYLLCSTSSAKDRSTKQEPSRPSRPWPITSSSGSRCRQLECLTKWMRRLLSVCARRCWGWNDFLWVLIWTKIRFSGWMKEGHCWVVLVWCCGWVIYWFL